MLPVLVLGVLCTEKGYLDNILLLVAHKVVAQHPATTDESTLFTSCYSNKYFLKHSKNRKGETFGKYYRTKNSLLFSIKMSEQCSINKKTHLGICLNRGWWRVLSSLSIG